MAKFYKTKEDEIIVVPEDVNVEIVDSEELVPNSVDAAGEKHVPVVNVDGNNVVVNIGEVSHPMVDDHYIDKVFLETNKGFYEKNLKPDEKPETVFILEEDEKPIKAYEYCTLHGLWEKAI